LTRRSFAVSGFTFGTATTAGAAAGSGVAGCCAGDGGIGAATLGAGATESGAVVLGGEAWSPARGAALVAELRLLDALALVDLTLDIRKN
jgi:hypothetical protein